MTRGELRRASPRPACFTEGERGEKRRERMGAKSSMGAHILVFPFPAQGHMLPLLDLAHHLDAAGLSVTIVVTTKNRPLLNPLLSRSPEIEPLVLPFPDHPSIPPGIENNKDLPPSYFPAMMHALAGLHHPLLRWARSHPSPPRAILSDMFLGWTNALAASLGIPRLVFFPSGALCIAGMNCLWRDMPKPADPSDPGSPVPFPSIPGSPIYPWCQISSLYQRYREGDPLWEFIKEGFLQNTRSWGYVFNTFNELEGRYLEHLRVGLGHSRVWAVGPLCPLDDPAEGRGGPSSVPAAEILAWLDRFEEGTVVYVCFGSQATLERPQAKALAAGLERSGARFVWCVRGPADSGGGGWVTEGFEERVAGRGLVIRGWAPQVAVLGHRAVGWFLTHCGWNSTLEAIASGVSLLTWPMTADQFFNARLLVEEAGVAVRACEGIDASPDPDELARILAESMDELRPERKRAAELRRSASEAVGKGGSSYGDLQALAEELYKLKL